MTDFFNSYLWPLAGWTAAVICFLIAELYLIIRQNEYLQTNHIAEEETAVLESRMEIQDSSAEYISDELHDNIGQKLALAKLLLTTLPKDLPTHVSGQVQSSIDVLGEAMTEVRNLSSGLRNDTFRQHGMLEATKAEIKKLRKAGAHEIKFKVVGEAIFLSENRELVLFRAIQEVLQNIIKHASATNIDIIIEYQANDLLLDITDNGVGFDSANRDTWGSGITNIDKRLYWLRGKVGVYSKPGEGTRIIIILPYHDSNKKV